MALTCHVNPLAIMRGCRPIPTDESRECLDPPNDIHSQKRKVNFEILISDHEP